MDGNRYKHKDVEVLKNDIRNRLAKVCAGWSDADREALVNKVTVNELRYPSGRLTSDIIMESEAERLHIQDHRA